MQRRGVSEAISAILLLAVVAVTSYMLLNSSTKNIVEEQNSITDTIEIRGAQIQELISVISKNITPENIRVEIINYGTHDITIKKAFADGILQPFTVSDSDGTIFENNTIPQKKIMTILVHGTGNSAQIITGSKNIISLFSN